MRYYFFASIFILVPFACLYYLISKLGGFDLSATGAVNISSSDWLFLLIPVVAIPIILWIDFYYLKIKLRYIWVVFLDNFGKTDFSFEKAKDELNKLNEISKTDSFKKSLIINVGADVTEGLTDLLRGQADQRLNKLGKNGNVTGNVLGTYGSEFANQLASYAKITGNFILYRFACSVLYGQTQEVNESI